MQVLTIQILSTIYSLVYFQNNFYIQKLLFIYSLYLVWYIRIYVRKKEENIHTKTILDYNLKYQKNPFLFLPSYIPLSYIQSSSALWKQFFLVLFYFCFSVALSCGMYLLVCWVNVSLWNNLCYVWVCVRTVLLYMTKG